MKGQGHLGVLLLVKGILRGENCKFLLEDLKGVPRNQGQQTIASVAFIIRLTTNQNEQIAFFLSNCSKNLKNHL